MKKFIFSILSVSVFFIGVGALVEKTGAKFKSDEKALALIAKSRVAIGGDSALASVQSLRIVGQTTKTIRMDGTERTVTGETEIALALPDKLMKSMEIRHDGEAGAGEKMINKQIDVVVFGEGSGDRKVTVTADGTGEGTAVKKIVIKKDDGTTQEFTGAEADKIIAADGGQAGDNVRHIIIKKPDGTIQEMTGPEADKVIVGGKTKLDKQQIIMHRDSDHAAMKQNELLRLTLGLLLTAPQGMDVSYTFGGESSVDGTACNIVNAEFAGASYKIYLGQTSNLPVMMTYKGMPMPMVIHFQTKDDKAGDAPKENVMLTRTTKAPDMVEYSVKFSDYRSVGGVQLPYKWTTTASGNPDETFDVTTYEVNPANIADKFQNQKVMVRVARPATQN